MWSKRYFNFIFECFDNSWSISAYVYENLLHKLNTYKYLWLNFFLNFFPAPEQPDLESIIMFLTLIILFLIKELGGSVQKWDNIQDKILLKFDNSFF